MVLVLLDLQLEALPQTRSWCCPSTAPGPMGSGPVTPFRFGLQAPVASLKDVGTRTADLLIKIGAEGTKTLSNGMTPER